jgi:capsular polysaccharide biosynthesis protein
MLLAGLICGVVGAVAAFVVANQLPKSYQAHVSLVAPTMADTFAEIADSPLLLTRVTTRLHLQVTPDALAGRVNATASRTSALLTIVALDSDPAQAAAIANAVAEELVLISPDITGSSTDSRSAIDGDLATAQSQIEQTQAAIATLVQQPSLTPTEHAQVTTLQSQLVSLLGVRSSLLTLRSSPSLAGLTSLGAAETPTKASSPQVTLLALIGALFGIAIGLGASLLLNVRATARNGTAANVGALPGAS